MKTPQKEGNGYRIIRFYKRGKNELIKCVDTIEEARAWCSREDTRDPKGKWFDGFTKI